MPTYDYQCAACGHAFEKFQSITANPLRKCPECGKLKLKRLIGTGGGIIFKGSGFYETDYNRSSDYQEKAKKETSGDSESKSENKDTKKTETKTESKSDTKKSTKKSDEKAA
jgi:putative FmdB family regulatory protein